MPKEQAYSILKSIATINNLEKNLVLVEPTKEELEDEEDASELRIHLLVLNNFILIKI